MTPSSKKTDPMPFYERLKESEESHFELIHKTLVERHRKADTDGTRRRARQTAEDNRLL